MTEKPDDLTGIPEGDDVGDISSGFGNPDAHHGVSDEKAEEMLATRKAEHDKQHEAHTIVERPADSAGGQGAKSW